MAFVNDSLKNVFILTLPESSVEQYMVVLKHEGYQVIAPDEGQVQRYYFYFYGKTYLLVSKL